MRSKQLVSSLMLFSGLCGAQHAQAAWGVWQSMGGEMTGAPTFVSSKTGNGEALYMIAARGMDGAMWTNQKVGKGNPWSGWQSQGGIIMYSPTCISREAGIIDCFALDKNAEVVEKSWVNGAWNGWSATRHGMKTNGPLSVFARDADYVEIVATGSLNGGPLGAYSLEWRARGLGFPGTPDYISEGWQQWLPLTPAFPESQKVMSRVACDGYFDEVPKQGSAWGLNKTRPKKMGGCSAPFFGAKGAYGLATYGGDLFSGIKQPATAFAVLSNVDAAFPPSLGVAREPGLGLVMQVYYIDAKEKSLRAKRWIHGSGWKAIGASNVFEKNYGGVLTSSPSCNNTGCFARGSDGAVWGTGTFDN